jgi:hypothetical protein
MKAEWSPFDRSKFKHMKGSENDVMIEVVATATESAPIGEFDGTLVIKTEIPNNERILVQIHGLVVSNIIGKPPALFLTTVQGKSTSKNITIESRAGHLPDLQDVTVTNELPIKVEQLSKDSKAIVLSVTCASSTEERHNLGGDIMCHFAHDEVLTIPVIVHSQQQK